jgi:hypothetical protein
MHHKPHNQDAELQMPAAFPRPSTEKTSPPAPVDRYGNYSEQLVVPSRYLSDTEAESALTTEVQASSPTLPRTLSPKR